MNTMLLRSLAFVLLAGTASYVPAQNNRSAASGDSDAARGRSAARGGSPDAFEFGLSNLGAITINDNTTASPYPSSITVNNPAITTVTKVKVALVGFRHTFPDDVDIVLVGPQGQRAVLMSDAGGGEDVNTPGIILTFSSSAATALPDSSATALTAGTYRPANYETAADTFPAPGPGALTGASTDLNVFNLTNPNGTWSLYVVDDVGQDVGAIEQGWNLILTVPTVFTITKTADTNDGVCDADCSLREAITAAQNDDLINFSALFNAPQTINLLTALPDITRSITIQGPGAHLLTVRRDFNAATDFRIFNIPVAVANGVAISGMTIAGGHVPSNEGGGILSHSALTLTNVHVTDNHASFGGGVGLVFSNGTFTGCTFSGNRATSVGGGIDYLGTAGSTLRLVNSTVSGNRSGNSGGGIRHAIPNGSSRMEITNSTIANNTAIGEGGIGTFTLGAGATATTTLRNTIIAVNSPNNMGTGTLGGGATTVETLGFNLSDNFNGVFAPLGTDITSATPRLGPLSLGGGTTPTHAVLGGSPAIDAGNNSGATADQRDQPRIFDTASIANVSDGADIGAVEMRSIVVTTTSDANAGSLRQALTDANANGGGLDDIIFGPLFDTSQVITLFSALPEVATALTINGTGAHLLTVRRDFNAPAFRIFNIPGGVANGVAISAMTITGGRGPDGQGGGMLSLSALTLTNVHVTGNLADFGGGVYLSASGVFTGCTFSGNTARFSGAGVYFLGVSGEEVTLRVVNSTLSGNRANTAGGSNAGGGGVANAAEGIFLSARVEVVSSTITNNDGGGILTSSFFTFEATATTALRNSIVAGNSPNNLATQVSGPGPATVETLGFNLANDNGGGFLTATTDRINANAGLAQLAFNGTGLPTHSLVAGSQAVDAGNNSGSGILTDQRGPGFLRTVDLPLANATGSDGTDIGAFEAQTDPPPAFLLTAGVSRLTHTTGTFDIDLPLTGDPGIECRQGNGNHTLVFTFSNNIAGGTFDIESGTAVVVGNSLSNNILTITLTGVTNAQIVRIAFRFDDNFGQRLDTSASIGFLVGDTNGGRSVGASDIGQVKSQSGLAVTSANFRTDVNVSGATIGSTDISLVKSRSGTSIPTP